VGFGCCSIHSGVQDSGQYQGSVGWLGGEGPEGWELGAGDWEDKAVAPVRRRPLHQMERILSSQTMQQHSLPYFSGYMQREVKCIPGVVRLGRPSPSTSPSPLPFFVNVYLTLPARKSIYCLSGRPEGQLMKLPVTQTSFGPHLRRGPNLSRYLWSPAGLNLSYFSFKVPRKAEKVRSCQDH